MMKEDLCSVADGLQFGPSKISSRLSVPTHARYTVVTEIEIEQLVRDSVEQTIIDGLILKQLVVYQKILTSQLCPCDSRSEDRR
jgi:hypothetical protein